MPIPFIKLVQPEHLATYKPATISLDLNIRIVDIAVDSRSSYLKS